MAETMKPLTMRLIATGYYLRPIVSLDRVLLRLTENRTLNTENLPRLRSIIAFPRRGRQGNSTAIF